ncbi:MAG: crossover junction endodeoxyribonuclease RuvC [Lactobacillales bacterium]|jgi:crossover junction endodeoxyribonuclease RuvC|nr:crossover junction endodeoxyribonuclease RuvC [Lactobacillales bacterium]
MVVRILGLDPGLRHTGWGIVEKDGNKFKFIAAGVINPNDKGELAHRLAELYDGVLKIVTSFSPDEAAVEETFVNKNPNSTLKLGQARGISLLVPALHKMPVAEYTPNQIKKMIVGVGHADKTQVDMMVRTLLKTVPADIPVDASDALAIALCHGFMRNVF